MCSDLQLLDSILLKTKSLLLPDDIKDDVTFTAQTACDSIRAWKSHQLRMVHQDNARVDIIDSLDEQSALLVQDFAMKYLPKHYRETQAQFFGKRGISWHITVCQTNINGEFCAQTFVHIIESRAQDSKTVVTIMENVLQILKKEHPEMKNIFYRQDNAGCYHSALTILACKVLRQRTGLNLSQLDFCDPQGGKGPCDRKAAQIKYHINTYINEGHSVTTPSEMKTAIESRGGVPGVRVISVEAPPKNKLPAVEDLKFEGISTLFNFVFTDSGFTSFKAYNVGKGKFCRWSEFEGKFAQFNIINYFHRMICYACNLFSGIGEIDKLPWLPLDDVSDGDFKPIKGRRIHSKHKTSQTQDLSDDENVSTSTTSPDIFSCPEDSCIKTYMTHRGLEQHLTYGKHEKKLEKMGIIDKAKISYSQRLEAGSTRNVTQLPPKTSKDCCYQSKGKGWALHEAGKSRKRFSVKQKEYMKKKFVEGEKTGRKCTGEEVAKEMRCVRNEKGERLFTVDEFLRPQQIQSFFSRYSAKMKGASLSDEEADIENQRSEELCNDLLVSMSSGICHHPMLFSGKNVCEMSDDQMIKLKVTELRSMANHFSLKVKDRRKDEYLQAIKLFLSTCECKN